MPRIKHWRGLPGYCRADYVTPVIPSCTVPETLLMHGARAIVLRWKGAATWPWLAELLKRWPCNVAVAAVANKLARTIWAVLARGQAWRPEAWQAAH